MKEKDFEMLKMGKLFQHSQGNMAEYLLPTVLIGMVAVAGLSWSLSGQFAAQGGRSLFQAETSQVGNSGKALLNSRAFGKNPNLQTYTLTLANGKTIQIPDMPVSVADNIDVDGGHGTTDKLLAALEKLRKALVDSGELTEADSQPFKDLANAGHGFGDSQALMENIMNQCGTDKKCVKDALHQNNQPNELWNQNRYGSIDNVLGDAREIPGAVSLNGIQMSLLQKLQPSFINGLNKDPSYNYDSKNLKVGPNILRFLSAFEKVEQLSVFLQPAVSNVVFKMSQNIFTLQRSSLNSATEVMGYRTTEQRLSGLNDLNQGEWANHTPDKYLQGLKANFNEILPNDKDRTFRNSDITHASAGVICTTGKGSDTGQQCQ